MNGILFFIRFVDEPTLDTRCHFLYNFIFEEDSNDAWEYIRIVINE
ncbi:hypothetical protein XSR1_20168 [Xenorhabdus szentirmaii DSM 16338]|uniref:Uncharacterized protein n=1 Tax=Xenorhabdus szentirmaii DSM 16338 TaxID=1427518 RepID=W1IYP7_9GAMM|nr:hypothetical protein XSR1_20168 [Xenorhabdus szentirmaii DSM 16338]